MEKATTRTALNLEHIISLAQKFPSSSIEMLYKTMENDCPEIAISYHPKQPLYWNPEKGLGRYSISLKMVGDTKKTTTLESPNLTKTTYKEKKHH